jgi:hypothetical protein
MATYPVSSCVPDGTAPYRFIFYYLDSMGKLRLNVDISPLRATAFLLRDMNSRARYPREMSRIPLYAHDRNPVST